ncbi:MAG: ribonuclease P protein subunit [Candidatus Marsarchaeota archaeon]|jgi:ribonuclease P protein subunit POP4|nr:ribonuclease P protein subunit [Candidatus Marsarchaeota archaeon]
MEYNNKNIVLNELIGLKARVLSSLDKKQRGASGIVIDETKNTLLLEAKEGRRRIVKKACVFRFYVGHETFDVDGKEINFRPDERIEKAMKYYRQRR